jgi:hypothetical protein
MVDEKNTQHDPAEEEQSEFSDTELNIPEHEDVDEVKEDFEAETRTEDHLGDADSAQMVVPEQVSHEPASLSAVELSNVSTMPPEVAAALAEAEARRAEAAESSRGGVALA